jgi:hypothetical protein
LKALTRDHRRFENLTHQRLWPRDLDPGYQDRVAEEVASYGRDGRGGGRGRGGDRGVTEETQAGA